MKDSYSEDEISLTDILFFLQDSIGSVILSVLACVILGGAYYFSTPKLFEASATIQMAMATGNPVETPTVLLEKIKLPLYFSQAACGLLVTGFRKILPSIRKHMKEAKGPSV